MAGVYVISARARQARGGADRPPAGIGIAAALDNETAYRYCRSQIISDKGGLP